MRIKFKVNLNDVPDTADTPDMPLSNGDEIEAQPDLIVVGETAVTQWYVEQGTDEVYKKLIKEGRNEV